MDQFMEAALEEAGTFQDRLITELRLAGATTLEQAKAVLKQFLPRFDRRFGVPTQCPEPAFRPLQRDLPLEQVLCFKHRRRVARDNTVKYQRHTLQLLPDSKRRSYAGTVVEVLEGLDGILALTILWDHFTICITGRYHMALCGSYQKERSENSGSVIQNPSNHYLHGIER